MDAATRSDIVRYDLERCDGESGRCRAEVGPCIGGDWVLYADHVTHVDAAVAEAVKERDAENSRLRSTIVELREQIGEWSERVNEARREERASIADWFQETFCPRSGVPGDEKHARGDCDYCNMAAAIRRPASAPEGEK